MDEAHVHCVHRIFDSLKPIDRPDARASPPHSVRPLEFGKVGHLGRCALAHEREDHACVVGRSMVPDLYFRRKTRFFGGHFDALAAAVVFPTVVPAAYTLAFDPPDMKKRRAMSAFRG